MKHKNAWLNLIVLCGLLLPLASATSSGAYAVDLLSVRNERAAPARTDKELFHTVAATKYGPDDAGNVIVTYTLPLGPAYLADTYTCTLSAGTGPAGRVQLVCDLGEIPAEESRDFEINLQVDTDAVALEANGTPVIRKTVEASSDRVDESPGRDTLTESTTVADSADLMITKVGRPDNEVRVGEELVYTIYVDNYGPSDAHNVHLRDTLLSDGSWEFVTCDWVELPSGFTSASMACGPVNDVLVADIDLIPVYTSTNPGRFGVSYTLSPNEIQDVTNQVRVTSDTPDPNSSNNLAEVSTAVVPSEPMLMKQVVRDDLTTLPSTGDNKTDDRIKDAIAHINKSLDPDLWETGWTLTDKGKRVFDEEEKAAKELAKIHVPDVSESFYSLLDVDQALARLAIEEAIAAAAAAGCPGGSDDHDCEKVMREIAMAQEELAKAIEQYKKAWEHAQKAMEKLG